MTVERYVVFDTNVIISAVLIKQSVARQAFDKALQQGTLLLSLTTLEELNDVLKRKKFDTYIRENERIQFLATLVNEAMLVEVHEIATECRDPKDNKFLELAVSGNAACIVSGDKDLLALHFTPISRHTYYNSWSIFDWTLDKLLSCPRYFE